ncbi:SDR family oxidoreductase [Sphingomonas jatrophae]|uniref:Short-chain dehydrogenase n=1 Tax=Sphingomonas jatrophae TaxID=1166337 RepID=A0A1I6JUR0_9SPHN|nr:SDR family oxidoreductase [Sphingomonas jatrophae]SFR82628.1 Short-chain dehydrogenase [Sphingomonas jatrophae]
MTLRLKPLDQQVILVTGASSGIGLVTAKRAAARGAKVMLVARGEAALAEAVHEIEAAGGAAACAVADVGDRAAVEAAAQAAVARFGRIDTWVNNAGVAIYARLLDTPADEHEQLFRTNYFGAVHGCEVAVRHLRDRGGALITVGSIGSELPSPVLGAYSASKHAVRAYVSALRMELGDAGVPVSVTLVMPAGIDTPIGQHAANHEGKGEAQIPPPTYDPVLVADAILDACTRPRREITVGGAGRAQVLFGLHFPSVMEWLAPKMAKSFTDDSKPQPRPSNLFRPVRGGQERSGERAPRQTSLYTAAARHPKTSAAVAAGVIGAAVWLRRRER